MKWFDNQKSNNINSSVLPFELHRVSENTYDEIVKRQDGYYLIKRCGTMPYSGVHNHTEFVTDGYTLVYALPRSQQQEIKLDWTPPKTHGDSTTFIVNSGGAIPEIEGTLAIDRRYVEWREDKQGQTIAVAPLNIDYNRKAYIDKIYGDEQPVGELVVDDEGNESYELAINTVEFPSLKTYDGVTHVSSHGQTLSPHMEIQAKQMVDGEEVLSSFEGKNITISDSTVGEIESATLYGETLVNVIKEPRAEVVLPYSFEDGESATIENTKATGSLEGVVLKGNTEVVLGKNLFNGKLEDGCYSHNTGKKEENPNSLRSVDFIKVEPSSTICCSNNGIERATHIFEYDENKKYLKCNEAITKATLLPSTKYITFYGGNGDRDKMQIEYGEEPTYYEEYKQTLTSVRMPVLTTFNTYNILNPNNTEDLGIYDCLTLDYYPVEIGTKLSTTSLSGGTYWSSLYLYDENKTLVHDNFGDGNRVEATFTISNPRAKFVRFKCPRGRKHEVILNYGDIKPYEPYTPYKSTILSCNEPVELRGIGDVKDELNLLTGEMTKQYGVAIMDGSDDENYIDNYNEISFVIYGEVNNQIFSNMKKNSYKILCDKYYVAKDAEDGWRIHNDSTATGIYWFNNNLWIRIPLENLGGSHTKQAFKTWLQSNPITIQYELATPVVKTVDLSIVDQNGVKKDKLQTFDGVTHLAVSTPDGSLNPIITSKFEIPVNIKPNTQYSIIKDSYTNGHDNVPFTLDLGGAEVSSQIGERVTLVTTPNTLTHNSLKPSGWGQKLTNLMVIEGDLTGSDIPYIEGMQSVEMPVLTTTGKNLFDISQVTNFEVVDNNIVIPPISSGEKELIPLTNINPNQPITITLNYNVTQPNDSWTPIIGVSYKDGTRIESYCSMLPLIASDDKIIESIYIRNPWSVGVELYDVQIEQGTVATTYEPFKSNILTVNEDVELRGIGDVQDTLDCLTGEVTQRIGEIILNGGDEYTWTIHSISTNTIRFQSTNIPIPTQSDASILPNILCDKLKVVKNDEWRNDEEQIEIGIGAVNRYEVNIRINKTKLNDTTPNSLNKYLQSNPIRIQYIAEEPIVKNVVIGNGEDLSLDETRVKLPRPLGKDEALEWNSSANHYQIIRYENGIKSAVEDCKELFNRYVVPLRDKVKTFVTSKASKLLLDLPYRKVRELTVPDNFTVVLDNENDLVTMSWDVVVGATDYDIYLDGTFLTRVNTNQYQRREEIKGHLKVRAVNDLTMSDFTEETYVLSVPNETFISLVENRYENGHVFTVTFADYSEIETGFRVRWSPDGRDESYADVAGATGTGMVMKHTFTVPLIQDYIDIRVNSYNDTGENPIVPPIHLEMSPTPIWTYKETMGQVMLQWSNTIDNTEHYVLKYKIEGTSDYVYETILSDGYDTITGYIDLGEDDLAEVSIAGVVDGLTHVYCKPFKVGKSVDETLLPPQNFAYRAISENEFEFSWTDSYTCEREFELILSHSDGRIERIIVPSTSSSTTGRKYTYRYKLQEYGYFGVKLRMNWELGNSAYTQEYTIYYLPTVVEPPAYIRKERRENEVSLQWEAQSFVDYYALYLSINGDEIEYEVKNNHYEFRINFEEEPEIRAYIRTHFLDGKVSSSSSVLQFRPCYSPNPYMVTMANVVTEEKVLDCNIISPEVVQDYPLYTGSISKTEVSYPVSMSSVTKFTMVELPMTSEFWGKSLETDGHILSYVCRSNVEQSRYPLNVLTYKPTENIIPILETTILNYVYEAPITTEINRVRITTIGDSITAGHPNYWAETGTGDVRSQYQYWLNRKLNGQFEIINKGYGSDTTDKMVARFDKDVLETYPQYCIIQGGTNDLM